MKLGRFQRWPFDKQVNFIRSVDRVTTIMHDSGIPMSSSNKELESWGNEM